MFAEGVKMKKKKKKKKRRILGYSGSLPLAKKSHIVVGSVWKDCSIRRNHLGLSHCNAKGKCEDMKDTIGL